MRCLPTPYIHRQLSGDNCLLSTGTRTKPAKLNEYTRRSEQPYYSLYRQLGCAIRRSRCWCERSGHTPSHTCAFGSIATSKHCRHPSSHWNSAESETCSCVAGNEHCVTLSLADGVGQPSTLSSAEQGHGSDEEAQPETNGEEIVKNHVHWIWMWRLRGVGAGTKDVL